MIPYKAPKFKETAFNCPNCGAYANQIWFNSSYYTSAGYRNNEVVDFCYCAHCSNFSLWHNRLMIYPNSGSAPLPNSDLPKDIKDDYEEARSIVSLSPRGAAALLRLAIQKLCKHLGEKGHDLNADIKNLVKKGLHSNIQKSLDFVRVIGNNAVHPGQIDLKDNVKIAEKLFVLVNLISEAMITQPKHVDELYESLPQVQKEAINKRDKRD